MSSYWIGSALVLIILVLLIKKRGPSLPDLVDKAIKEEDISPLMVAIASLPMKKRPSFFQQAIEMLWNGWHRVLAAELIREFVTMHPDDRLGHYWIQKVLEVEPEAAEEVLDDDFIENFYRQDLAATCGPAG